MTSPPKPQIMVRKRVYHRKARTGCITCKIRKIRCDEAKPSCVRCTSTGRKCDGYAPQPGDSGSESPAPGQRSSSVSRRHRRAGPDSSTTATTAVTLGGGVSEFPGLSPQEIRSFQFFCNFSGPSFFWSADADVWARLIPQASHMSPAIWHAAASLGALHERFLVGHGSHLPANSADPGIWFALQQFNKAIEYLVHSPLSSSSSSSPLSSSQTSSTSSTLIDKNIALTVCILFTAICNLQGVQKQAFLHLQGGLKLLQEFEQDLQAAQLSPPISMPIPYTTLQAIFTSLDTQACAMLNEDILPLWKYRPSPLSSFTPDVADFTPSKLYIYTQNLFNNILHFVQQLEQAGGPTEATMASIVSQFQLFLARHQLLDAAFTHLSSTSPTPDRIFRRLMALVESDLIICHMFLTLRLEHGESMWDAYEPDFKRLLELCEVLLKADYGELLDSTPNNPQPSLSPSSSASLPFIIPSDSDDDDINTNHQHHHHHRRPPVFAPSAYTVQTLWLVTSRCRNPRLRRWAHSLLCQYPRREGIWDSDVAARICWEVIELEEVGSGWSGEDWKTKRAADVVGEAKLRHLDVIFVSDRKATARFTMHSDFDARRPGPTKEFEW